MNIKVEERYRRILHIVSREFPEIVELTEQVHGKVRVHLLDGSYLDIWLSRRIPGRYAYHWEHRHIDGGVHRHDNRPHERLRNLRGFPKHFHNGCEENIEESEIPDEPEEAVKAFLTYIRHRLGREIYRRKRI